MSAPGDAVSAADHDPSTKTFSGAEVAKLLQTETTASPEAASAKPEYHFVVGRHTIENAPAMGRELHGYDRIMIELVGGSQDRRHSREHQCTEYLAATTSAERRAQIAEILQHDDPFTAVLLNEVTPQNQQVKFIDVSRQDEAETALVELEDEYFVQYVDAVALATPNAKLKLLADRHLHVSAQVDDRRERIRLQQLISEGRQPVADGRAPRVVIIGGIAHENERGDLEDLGYKTSATIVDTPGQTTLGLSVGVHLSRYSYEREALKQIRARPNEEVTLSDELLNRVVLERTFRQLAVFLAPGQERTSHNLGHAAIVAFDKVIQNMSDDQVTRVLDYIDEAKVVGAAAGEDPATINEHIKRFLYGTGGVFS